MKNQRETKLDAYSNHIINRIPKKVMKSLSTEQKDAIAKAIRSGVTPKEHAIDVRGVIPLFFKKYYFVFHFGRDTRSTTKDNEEERRKKTRFLTNTLFIFLTLLPLFPIIFLILYMIKSALGIDIFHHSHLEDFLKIMWNWVENLIGN